MHNIKIIVVLCALLLFSQSALCLAEENSSCGSGLRLPSAPVDMYIDYGESSRFRVFFIGMGEGADIADWTDYNAWCLNRYARIEKNAVHEVALYADYNAMPPELEKLRWDRINYLINHKLGDRRDVQSALWRMVHGKGTVTGLGARMVEDAEANGNGFVPVPGECMAVVCFARGKQPAFIEFPIPGAYGCFPDPVAMAVKAPDGFYTRIFRGERAMFPPPGLISLGEGGPEPTDHGGGKRTPAWNPTGEYAAPQPDSTATSDPPPEQTLPPGPPPPTPTPAPAAWLLLASGLGLLSFLRKKRMRRS
jgi:hypothetical protein